MRWAERFRERQLVRSSLWIVPSCYVIGALILGVVAPWLDRRLAVETTSLADPESTRTVLSAIATGMITLTGFVFSFLMLLVQFGSTAFTPRLNRTLRRDWVVKHALGAFTATFMFSLSALLALGRVGPDVMLVSTLLIVGALLLLSLALFFAMITRVLEGLRVSRVIRMLTRRGHEVLDDVYQRPFDAVSTDPRLAAALDRDSLVQVLRYRKPSAVLVARDRHGLADVARRERVTIELLPAVGDDIGVDAALFRIYGDQSVPEEPLRAALVVGDERTLEDDPGFALRLLVDIAIRALSPAVNDPTTAVQVLDGIAELLSRAASKHLDIGVVADEEGVWFVGHVPTWPDLLRLGVTEIRLYGRNSVQVLRRIRALLEGLLETTPAPRHEAVQAELDRLDATVEAAFADGGDRLLALQPDPQGIGPSRPASDGQ